MSKWLILLFLILLSACREENVNIYFTPEKASAYFREVEEICNRDNGKLWGRNLYGPLMFVDRPSRRIFANMPDKGGILKLKDGIYTGTFPRELIVDNIATEFGGTLFSVAPLPPEEDNYRITTRAIHGLFHGFQKSAGLTPGPIGTK